eukprot:4820511-Pyramimonas_sp.AAC.1
MAASPGMPPAGSLTGHAATRDAKPAAGPAAPALAWPAAPAAASLGMPPAGSPSEHAATRGAAVAVVVGQ